MTSNQEKKYFRMFLAGMTKKRSQEPETAFCRDLFTFYLFSFPNDWTNGLPPHSLPEDSIVANTVEVAFHSQMLLNKHKRKLRWKSHEDMSH